MSDVLWWFVSYSEVPNWFMCLGFVLMVAACWAFNDASKTLKRSSRKWNEVAAMYADILGYPPSKPKINQTKEG